MNTNKSIYTEYIEEIGQFKIPRDEKGLKIYVMNEEYYIENERLICSVYPILNKVKNCYDSKTQIFTLPNSIDNNTFELFLSALCYSKSISVVDIESSLNQVDCGAIKRLFDVCIYFNTIDIIIKITNDFIITKIDKDNCLDMMKQFMNYLSYSSLKETSTHLINQCLICASDNIFHLLNNQKEVLLNLQSCYIDDIIQLYFKNFFFTRPADDSQIMSLLMYNRKIKNDIFELLELERKRAIALFEKDHAQKQLENPFTWKIKIEDSSKNSCDEKHVCLENLDILLINYYDAKKDIFNLAIQITHINIPSVYNTINNTNTYATHKNNSKSNINYANESLDEINYENHIISILSVCEILEINYPSKINFNCIYSNSMSRVLIFKIENFSQYFSSGTFNSSFEFSLEIYFSLNYNFSSILNHICKYFNDYYSLNSITKISHIVLNIILRNECLYSKSEDEILYAIMNWVSNKPKTNGKTIHELCNNIHWQNISLEALINVLMFENKSLMMITELKKIIFCEFQRRFQEEYAGSDKDYSVSMTETEVNDSSSNFNRVKYSHFTNDFLNKLMTVSDRFNLSSIVKTEKKETMDQEKNLTSPTGDQESSVIYLNKSNRNKSNGSKTSNITNHHYPITTSFLVKKNDRQLKHSHNIYSLKNIPSISSINKMTPKTTTKTKGLNLNQLQRNINNHLNQNSSNINSGNTTLKSKLMANSIIERLIVRSATPDDIKNKQYGTTLNKSNQSSLGDKSRSLEKRQNSQSKFPKYFSQNNFHSVKVQKSTSKDRTIPTRKNVTSSARSELMKTEPQVNQGKKNESQRPVHYRSQSNH